MDGTLEFAQARQVKRFDNRLFPRHFQAVAVAGVGRHGAIGFDAKHGLAAVLERRFAGQPCSHGHLFHRFHKLVLVAIFPASILQEARQLFVVAPLAAHAVVGRGAAQPVGFFVACPRQHLRKVRGRVGPGLPLGVLLLHRRNGGIHARCGLVEQGGQGRYQLGGGGDVVVGHVAQPGQPVLGLVSLPGHGGQGRAQGGLQGQAARVLRTSRGFGNQVLQHQAHRLLLAVPLHGVVEQVARCALKGERNVPLREAEVGRGIVFANGADKQPRRAVGSKVVAQRKPKVWLLFVPLHEVVKHGELRLLVVHGRLLWELIVGKK